MQRCCEGGAPGEGVTGLGIVGFPKIEMERKPQRNFPADFIKLMLEHRGGSTGEGKVSEQARELAVLGAFIIWGQSGLAQKGRLSERQAYGIFHFGFGDFLFQLPGNGSVGAR